MEQSAAPASLCVLGQPGFRDGHGKEPPSLLGAECSPLAADDGQLIGIGRFGGPGENAKLLAKEAIHEIGSGMPAGP